MYLVEILTTQLSGTEYNNKNNFQNINTRLESLGFVSAYHTNTDNDFGCEESATFSILNKSQKSITLITYI